VWSILEVVEHLAMASPICWRQMKRPAASFTPAGTEEDILSYGIDRTQREKGHSLEHAKSRLRDLRPALDALGRLYAEMLKSANTPRRSEAEPP
jgi:hypothetical protein